MPWTDRQVGKRHGQTDRWERDMDRQTGGKEQEQTDRETDLSLAIIYY